MSAAVGGLGRAGEFVILGVSPKPLALATIPILLQKQVVRGWPSGTAIESEDTLKFSEITGVLPLIEKYPLERAAEAYDRMMSGKAHFRAVLETGV
jgi:D-arabinose 1-dehydrogenase-like Zn-dependent alcohol dehydrogenase